MSNNRPKPLLDDAYLKPYAQHFLLRKQKTEQLLNDLGSHADDLHLTHALHRLENDHWCLREWLPNATSVQFVKDDDETRFIFHRRDNGIWELVLPPHALKHRDTYRLLIRWPGGQGYRLPVCATRVIRRDEPNDPHGVRFLAQVWEPDTPYRWQHDAPRHNRAPIIYEAHVGMASNQPKIASYDDFRTDILPRISRAGYNTIQLMAVMEHPYYPSFGYHVSNFFSICDLFGTPDDFKHLVDEAHRLKLNVIIDLVHAHAVDNEVEGLGAIDGTQTLYCHPGRHPAWGSRTFDYAKRETCRLLLSNCRFWLEEYHLDGFRFDGITSMLYRDHGLQRAFSGYDCYFSDNIDEDALAYLAAANTIIRRHRAGAITIAEDVSGMPGLCAPVSDGGCGFDYRLALGVPDIWFALAKRYRDEDWPLGKLWYELTNHRAEEKTICYVECHDQCIVGGKTFIFTLADHHMYDSMHCGSPNLYIQRACDLHKLARLLTLATAGHGYLNFIGNEFGHPEWVDFPRAENGNSFEHAQRLWHLRDDPNLRFSQLADFDCDMLKLIANDASFFDETPELIAHDDVTKTILFRRHDLYFAFNFHPTETQPHLRMNVRPGVYSPVLVSDERKYGGYANIGSSWSTTSTSDIAPHIHLNLPPRTALVLRRTGDLPKPPQPQSSKSASFTKDDLIRAGNTFLTIVLLKILTR